MRAIAWVSVVLVVIAGCDAPGAPRGGIGKAKKSGAGGSSSGEIQLFEARAAFKTKLARNERAGTPAPPPPANLAQLVYYDAPMGKNAAYLTNPPSPGQKHPAILWISGGDCNTIDDGFFRASPAENDQTASAFRNAGIVTMYVSMRGGNNNPSVKEGFYGEVDDVIAALAFLKQQESVDPNRIYLGGHSTGATMALLVSECTDQFRAVFSFGPAEDVSGYGWEFKFYDESDPQESNLRSPLKWLHSIKSPTFVMESADPSGGNVDSLRAIKAAAAQNSAVHCFEVRGADHFSILAPVTTNIAQKILQDTGPSCNIQIQEAELNRLFGN